MNGHLSPKALSKPTHKICAWISESMLKQLNKKLLKNKIDMAPINTKSKIIFEAIQELYFSPDSFIRGGEMLGCRITFYLNQEQAQILWDLEGYYLGEGIKRITISTIIESALMNYLV